MIKQPSDTTKGKSENKGKSEKNEVQAGATHSESKGSSKSKSGLLFRHQTSWQHVNESSNYLSNQ
jgi:hypothetical protein